MVKQLKILAHILFYVWIVFMMNDQTFLGLFQLNTIDTPAYKNINTARKIYTIQQSKNMSICINTASKYQLMQLDGIGEKIAERIMIFRQQKRIDNITILDEVKGIGEKKINKIKNKINFHC